MWKFSIAKKIFIWIYTKYQPFFSSQRVNFLEYFAVSLHSPNGRYLPAMEAVQGDCQRPYKNGGNSHQSCEPIILCELWMRQSQCIFRPTNHKGWYKPIGGQISYPTDSPNATRLGLCSSLWTYQEGTGSTINTITDIQRAAQKISVPLCPHRENVLLQYDCFLCFECFVIRLVSLLRQCSFPEELYIVPRCVAGKFCTMSLSVFELGKHTSCEARWALHVQVTWKFQAPTEPPAATKSGLCFWHTPPELVFLWWLSMVMEQVINTRVSKVCPQNSTCFEMHCLQKAHIWKEQYTTWKQLIHTRIWVTL